MKNDPRVLCKKTKELSDFQPLCKHCNMQKKSASQQRKKTGERVGAIQYGYSVDFIKGNKNLDRKDVNWGVGTYWWDVKAFKKALTNINTNTVESA